MKTPPHAPRVRDYGRLLLNSWVVICCATILSGVAGYAVYVTRPPVYTATASLFATVPGAAGTRSARSGGQDALTRIETYAALGASTQVLTRTADDLGETPEEVAGRVTATVNPGSVLLSLKATAGDPDTALDTANMWAVNLIQVSKEIEWADTQTPAGPTGELNLVDGATSTTQTSGALSRYLSLGVGLGLALSSVLVLARGTRRAPVLTTEQLDYTVREFEQERPR